MAITDWPSHERPRERLIRGGPAQLSDAELLAIFLRTGTSGKSAVDLGREIMMHFGSLSGLFSAKLKDFAGLNGIGPAKYAQLQAILELARRLLAEDLQSGVTLSSSEKVTNYLQLYFGCQTHESFVVLFLDVRNKLIECNEMFRGTLSHTSVYPREIVKAALGNNAASVILAHNHPSGTVDPSNADKTLTRSLKQVLGLVDIRVLDHIIVAGGRTFSFAEHGIL
jgi:DNA repair protein RadC